jgi:hypothetical protein
MKVDRDAIRVVVPPVLALGLVVLLVHPTEAVAPAYTPAPAAVSVSVGR